RAFAEDALQPEAPGEHVARAQLAERVALRRQLHGVRRRGRGTGLLCATWFGWSFAGHARISGNMPARSVEREPIMRTRLDPRAAMSSLRGMKPHLLPALLLSASIALGA